MNKENEIIEVQTGNFMENVDTNLVMQTATKISTLTKIVTDNLKLGVHFGEIPGIKGKPTLFKAGAEKVVLTLGLTTKYTIIDKYINREYTKEVPEVKWVKGERVRVGTLTLTGFYEYAIECNLIDGTGRSVGSGIGSCNSNETKYNTQDPFGIANTILKMAKKRALVDAALGIANLSDQLTQDLDDMKANGLLKSNTKAEDTNIAGGLITSAQAKRLYAISGADKDVCVSACKQYGFLATKDVTKDKYEQVCDKAKELKEHKQ